MKSVVCQGAGNAASRPSCWTRRKAVKLKDSRKLFDVDVFDDHCVVDFIGMYRPQSIPDMRKSKITSVIVCEYMYTCILSELSFSNSQATAFV